jgi:TonB family protein
VDAREVEDSEVEGWDEDTLPRVDRLRVCTGLSLALHALFLGAMYLMPPGASALSLDTLTEDLRPAAYLTRPPEPVPDWLHAREPGEGEGTPAERAEPSREPAGPPRAATHGGRRPLPREQAVEQAKQAGILGALARRQGLWNAPRDLFDEALDYDPRAQLAQLFGAELGQAHGLGGLELHGRGRHGGEAAGTVGVGELATRGHADRERGLRYGAGVGELRAREADVPRLRVGEAEVRGSLSKETIRRSIQRRLNEVRYCYEQELTRRPDLRGRVQVKFVIAPDGAVQAAKVESSTLAAAQAEACIAQAVRRWSFPAPDGGVVIVSYPFVFDSAP